MKYLPLALVLAASPLAAQSFLFNVNNGFIPDGSGTGLVDARTVVTTTPGILSLEVRVNIAGVGAGAYNGDLYLTLQHGSGFSVLLNRPGVTALDPFGSPDNGFNVTFAATGTQGDIHNYRSILGTDENTILEPVTGRWEPDARSIDPDLVLETTPRAATFDSFTGIDPNGTWTLFAADLATGGLARLDSWELIITPVPEPAATVFVGALALGVFGGWRRWRR